MSSIGTCRIARNFSAIPALLAASLLASSPAQAELTSLIINPAQSQNPIFKSTTFPGGTVFDNTVTNVCATPPGSGAIYQKIAGTANGTLDPLDPLNAVIVDIANAPRDPGTGKVLYSINFVLLKPVDLTKGNHRLFALIPNRGSPNGLSNMIGGNFPTVTPALNMTNSSPGSGFLMCRGYSIVIMGWDPSAAAGDGAFNVSNLPVAKNPDGSSIVGPSLEEFVIDNTTTTSGALTYPVADTNKDLAKLYFRVRYQDPPQLLPSAAWDYANGNTTVRLAGGAAFSPGLYEFVYPAKDPVVAGIGLAGMRDIMSFLKYDTSAANPLANDVQYVHTHCSSQPCRTMHDYVYLGFNEDEHHRQVVDGVLNWIATGNFLKLNYRFSNRNGRTHRQHIARWYPEFEFPFSNLVMKDPVTGKVDGKFKRCLASTPQTCPKWMEIFSENEFYAKAGSTTLTSTSLNVKDLPDPPNTRLYVMSSLPHGAGTAPGMCQQFQNPLQPYSVLRAMLKDLDDWVALGMDPPASRVPRIADGTLVSPLQSAVGFPNIPARPPVANQDNGMPVVYNGRVHTGDLFDYGPRYATEGIVDNWPPISLKNSPYPVLVPKTDADGNDLAGIRLPEISVPTATYTGWGLRANLPPYNTPATFAGADGCDASGQKIPFRATTNGAMAIGDPRTALDVRYSSRQDYIDKVTAAANLLMSQRLMLQEDVNVYNSGAGAAYDTAILATP